MDNALLTMAEAANRLSVSTHTILRLHARRELPYVRIGGSIRFPLAAIDQWIADKTRYPDCGNSAEKPEEAACLEKKAARSGGSRTETVAGERLSNLLKLPTAPKPR